MRYGGPILTRWMLIGIFLVGASCPACTRAVPVSRSEFVWLNSEGGIILIRTRDGREFTTDRFEVAHNSIVVEALLEEGRRAKVEPFEVMFEDIESIERQEIHKIRTAAVIVPLVVAAGAVTYLVLVLSALGGAN